MIHPRHDIIYQRERERERERETERQTDRQTQTQRQTEADRQRQTDRATPKKERKERKTERKKTKQTKKQKKKNTIQAQPTEPTVSNYKLLRKGNNNNTKHFKATEQTTSPTPCPASPKHVWYARGCQSIPQCPLKLRHSPMKGGVVLAKPNQTKPGLVGWRLKARNTLTDIASYSYVHH